MSRTFGSLSRWGMTAVGRPGCRLVLLGGFLATALTSPRLNAQVAPPPNVQNEAEPAPAAPVIVPPELVHFEEAVYPPDAFAKGLEAEVLLKLVIDAQGAVTEAEVLEPVGNGFDEAAVAAAKQFVFTPAQRDGVPVPVAIKYVYRFTAAVAEDPAEEQQALPTKGNLEGRVLIAGPDVPLAGAKVIIGVGDDTPRLETITDADGRWAFVELEAGAYQVSVEAPGFDTMQLSEEVVAGEATEVTYRVSEPTEGIEIVVVGERPPREVTRRTLTRREISRIPGTGGDALRSIQSLPGVARAPGLAGLLIVRGSGPEDTNTFIDGALVPNIYHFGGLSSNVPTELLDKIDFYPGNFSARYGRVMGGIVDVGIRSPDSTCRDSKGLPTGKENCFHGLAQVDMIDTRLLLQGPVGKNWKFAVGGRRSWVDLWLKPVLEAADAGVTTAPRYYDYQAILEHEPNANSKFRLQFYGAYDEFVILLNNPDAQEPGFAGSLDYRTAFWRVQASHEQRLSNDWSLYNMVAVGRDAFLFSFGSLLFDFEFYPITTRSELRWNVAKGVKLNAGTDILIAPGELRVRAPQPPRDGEPAPPPFTIQQTLETSEDVTAYRPAWYVEGEIKPTERLTVVPGLRLDFARDSGHADLDPRISARYLIRGAESDVNKRGTKALKTVVKGGAGVYSQPPQFQETDEVFGTPNLQSNKSKHYSVGVEQQLTEKVDVSVEGYYKDLDNLVSRSGTDAGTVYDNVGDGRTYGVETLVRYNADARFFGWIAYTLSRSLRRNRPDEPEYLIQYDQTHNLTALGSYKLGRGWIFGARFRLISGSRYTPVVDSGLASYLVADTGGFVPIQGDIFGARLPLFHNLDVRVEKNWTFEHWRLMAYLDVWNAYNHASVEDVAYNFDYTRSTNLAGLPIIPSFGVRGEF